MIDFYNTDPSSQGYIILFKPFILIVALKLHINIFFIELITIFFSLLLLISEIFFSSSCFLVEYHFMGELLISVH